MRQSRTGLTCLARALAHNLRFCRLLYALTAAGIEIVDTMRRRGAVSNEEKGTSEDSQAAGESEHILDSGFLSGAVGVSSPRVSASVMSGGPDDGSSEVVHEHKSWSHHVMEEPEPTSGGRLRRTLRRWFGR